MPSTLEQYRRDQLAGRSWRVFPALAWLAVAGQLALIAGLYAAYAVSVARYKYGLNYSEGLIWQQALWLFGPHAYGDIANYPFLVFEYPPIYLLTIRALAASGMDMLLAGRGVSVLSTLAVSGLLFMVVRRLAGGCGRWPSLIGATVAAVLPYALLPIISWSPLLRVDMLGLALTYAGIALGLAAWRRTGLLYVAMLCFVLACSTKQTFVAAPLAMLLVHAARDRRLAMRAGALGLVTGVAILAVLSWLTHGGFLRHILIYNINRFSLQVAVLQSAIWLAAYPILAALTLAGIGIGFREVRSGGGPAAMHQPGPFLRFVWRLRSDETVFGLVFLLGYTGFSTLTLLFAGKSGASINYFIEWLCLWCAWTGWLAAQAVNAPALPAVALPLILVVQLWEVPRDITRLRAAQLSPERGRTAQSLQDRVGAIAGPVLSDDMVLLRRTGHEVGLEPAILAELAVRGIWREEKLTSLLRTHFFAAVVTAYGPGDPTFDARYLPATQSAILAAYPHVEVFGDYRLRLPGP